MPVMAAAVVVCSRRTSSRFSSAVYGGALDRRVLRDGLPWRCRAWTYKPNSSPEVGARSWPRPRWPFSVPSGGERGGVGHPTAVLVHVRPLAARALVPEVVHVHVLETRRRPARCVFIASGLGPSILARRFGLCRMKTPSYFQPRAGGLPDAVIPRRSRPAAPGRAPGNRADGDGDGRLTAAAIRTDIRPQTNFPHAWTLPSPAWTPTFARTNVVNALKSPVRRELKPADRAHARAS